MSRFMDDIIKALAKKYNLSVAAAKAICESPFKMASEKVWEGEIKTFYFPGFGKLAIKMKIRQEGIEYHKKRLEINAAKKSDRYRANFGGLEKPDIPQQGE